MSLYFAVIFPCYTGNMFYPVSDRTLSMSSRSGSGVSTMTGKGCSHSSVTVRERLICFCVYLTMRPLSQRPQASPEDTRRSPAKYLASNRDENHLTTVVPAYGRDPKELPNTLRVHELSRT